MINNDNNSYNSHNKQYRIGNGWEASRKWSSWQDTSRHCKASQCTSILQLSRQTTQPRATVGVPSATSME